MQLPQTMNAMVLEGEGKALAHRVLPLPVPSHKQVLIKVIACGVCRTDLHILDGELSDPKLPLIPGHEIIGVVAGVGANVHDFGEGDFVGVSWLGYTCGKCTYCNRAQENLCEEAKFTGYTIDGGYAEYTIANEHYCFPLPAPLRLPSKAPLLCAGLIGYRSYAMIDKRSVNIGIYGFGAAAHILIQVANKQGKRVFAFTRPGDFGAQDLAKRLGAAWVGDSSQRPPVLLDAAIIFAASGELVPKALQEIAKGGMVVCGGIHMSDIPSFQYDILWGEKILRSVANLTRKDGRDFLKIASEIEIKTEVQIYALNEANEALNALRLGQLKGAAVIVMG